MGEFLSKEHWQNRCETVEDDFLEIDAIIGDIIFFYEFAVAAHISLTVREKGRFWGHCLGKKQELGGTRFINKACILYKCLLGTSVVLQVQSKSRHKSSAKWKNHALNINKSLWFSGLGAGLSPWSHGFNICCIRDFFSAGLTILALLSSSWTHNILYGRHLPSKTNPAKIRGMFRNFIFHNPNP